MDLNNFFEIEYSVNPEFFNQFVDADSVNDFADTCDEIINMDLENKTYTYKGNTLKFSQAWTSPVRMTVAVIPETIDKSTFLEAVKALGNGPILTDIRECSIKDVKVPIADVVFKNNKFFVAIAIGQKTLDLDYVTFDAELNEEETEASVEEYLSRGE